jgi:hypothetical protein
MPYRQVLNLTPDQFVTVYARKMGEADPSSPSGASYRGGMDYYAECLHTRTRLRASQLPPTQYRKWHGLDVALDRWVQYDYRWNGLFNTDGTFWADGWADDSLAKEEALAHIETILQRPRLRAVNGKASLHHQFQLIAMDTIHHTVRQVYDHEDVPRFSALRTRSRHAAAELQQAADVLPSSCDAPLLTCIRQIYADIRDCATPAKG